VTEVVPAVDRDEPEPTEESSALPALGPAGWRKEAEVIAVPFVLAHVLSIGGWVLATVIKRRLRGSSYVPDSYAGVFGWGSWDARYYHLIAARGYTFERTGLRFFPLYPLIAKVIRVPLFGQTDLALLITAKVSLVIAAVLLYRLVRLETRDDHVARMAVWFLFLFPGAFVLTWEYSEPTFLALAIGSIYAMRTKRFGWAALLGVGAGLCRPLGIALVPAALIEGWRDFPVLGLGERVKRILAVVSSGIGMLLFLAWTGVTRHDFWAPLTAQNKLRTNESPVQRLVHLAHQMVGSDALKSGLHVPFIIVFTVLIVIVARRLPLSYAAYAAVVAVLTLSADNLNSLERYGLNAFPLVIGLAMFSRRDERIEWVAIALGAVTCTALSALALSASYVP
jgi:Gpi18-like mannosyltransferase